MFVVLTFVCSFGVVMPSKSWNVAVVGLLHLGGSGVTLAAATLRDLPATTMTNILFRMLLSTVSGWKSSFDNATADTACCLNVRLVLFEGFAQMGVAGRCRMTPIRVMVV